MIAVDLVGDVQVAWIDTNEVLSTRRFTASTGTWAATSTPLTTAPVTPANQRLWFDTIVMSPAGAATVAWVFDTNASSTVVDFNVLSRTQDASGAWLAPVSHTSTTTPTESGRPQLAVADDGTVTLVWFQYQYTSTPCGFFPCITMTAGSVYQQTRLGSTGAWQAAQALSDPAVISDSPTVTMTPAGETTVAWTEGVINAVKVLTRTVGGAFPVASAATIIVPQDRAIESGLLLGIPISTLRLASTAVGTVATFLRTNGTSYLPNAVFRPAGSAWPNPMVTAPAVLSAPGATAANFDFAASIDGLGNIVTAWTDATSTESATFDVSAPSFTAVNVPATGTTGQPVAMSSSTVDPWGSLGAGQPGWSFGDGATGAGSSVTHVFAAPGTYTVTVGASDTVGNVAAPTARQIVIANPPVPPLPQTTVEKPTSKITWKAGKLSNSTITLKGTVGGPASLTITVIAHATRKTVAKSIFAATAGAWSRTIKLPSTLAPGAYDVTVGGPVVLSSKTSFTLPAPATGIVKRTYATGPRRGPAVTTLAHTSELWAHFQFSVVPKKGQKITTQWILPNGHKLAANTRPRTSLVEAQVKDLAGKALPTGRWRCVVTVGKVVLATLNVRLK